MFPASSKGGGQCFAMPDVCKTPTPAGPVPIPYPSIGMVNQAKKTSKKLKICNKEAVTKKSEMSRSSGDEAGTAKGIVSSKNMDKVKYTKGSSKVKVEGQPLQHLTSPTSHNGSNANVPGAQIAPGQTKVIVK
jgi:hypothetical protein